MVEILVDDLLVDVARKAVKHLSFRVYASNGQVRIAAPLRMSERAIRLAIAEKMEWIKRHLAKFADQPRKTLQEIVSGESHHFLGKQYELNVIERKGRPHVHAHETGVIDLIVRPGVGSDQREQVLERWYRDELKALIPPLLEKWQPLIGVQVADWGIKKMKTRWGTCNITARRIWLSLELAKKSIHCLEYIIVHELVHLLERYHNARFHGFMDRFMPEWRLHKEELNSLSPKQAPKQEHRACS